jgi:hypothetical protein
VCRNEQTNKWVRVHGCLHFCISKHLPELNAYRYLLIDTLT